MRSDFTVHTKNKMAEQEEVASVTDKPRKGKGEGRIREKNKRQKLASHTTGPDCKCTRLKCFEVVKEEDRALLITSFNSPPNKDSQDSYLASLITVSEVQRRRPRTDEPRSYNNSYGYKVFVKGEEQDAFAYVCFSAFLSIFGIKKGRLETVKKSLASTGKYYLL